MGFKLIINNQGQFISEFKNFPMDKIPLYFKKENAGVIQAMLRECKTNFTELHTDLEKNCKRCFSFLDTFFYFTRRC